MLKAHWDRQFPTALSHLAVLASSNEPAYLDMVKDQNSDIWYHCYLLPMPDLPTGTTVIRRMQLQYIEIGE